MKTACLIMLLFASTSSVWARNPQEANVRTSFQTLIPTDRVVSFKALSNDDGLATDSSVFETIAAELTESANRTASTDISIPVDDMPTSERTVPADQLLPSWESWTSPDQLSNSLRVLAIMAALSVAPALVLMTTCYVRIAVVLSLLRHALGSQQLPPNQVTTALSMFLTALVMWPIWTQVHNDAIEPYTNSEVEMTPEEAWQAGVSPIREFMSKQIQAAGNTQDVKLFLDYLNISDARTYADVPLQALLPAYLISELKVAFLIGFQIYLPFLIVDLVVSSVTMSMGMVMVPPSTISLPMKLVLFVLADGWHSVVKMLLMSFHAG